MPAAHDLRTAAKTWMAATSRAMTGWIGVKGRWYYVRRLTFRGQCLQEQPASDQKAEGREATERPYRYNAKPFRHFLLDVNRLVTYSNIMSNAGDIGVRIRDLRRERGLTQDDLAERIGVSRSAVAQWETGRSGQVTDNLSRIAAVLDAGVEYLLHGNDKKAALQATQGDELALLRLYRECEPEDRQILLRTARRLARR